MVQKHKNRIWSLSAFLFLYLGLAVPGPFYFHVSSGFGTFCMFCIETHESVLFNQINLFLRGVLVASTILLIQIRWSNAIGIFAILFLAYYPLNDVIELMRTGELSIVYFIIPLITTPLSEQNYLWLYESNILVVYGATVSILGYFLLCSKFKHSERCQVSICTLFEA